MIRYFAALLAFVGVIALATPHATAAPSLDEASISMSMEDATSPCDGVAPLPAVDQMGAINELAPAVAIAAPATPERPPAYLAPRVDHRAVIRRTAHVPSRRSLPVIELVAERGPAGPPHFKALPS